MQDVKREILMQVANKTITPEEAAARIEELEREQAPEPAGSGSLRLVRIEARARSVIVIGDPTVGEAIADGPHTARREGDILYIEDEERDTFGFRFGPSFGFNFEDRPLTVRMNPKLALDVDLQAGSLRTRAIRAPIGARVQAGRARFDDFDGPLTLHVQAGDVRARGRMAEGESKIRCEAGSVRIELERDSSVRVRARSRLGKVELPNNDLDWVAGSGAATLDIDVGMGKAEVRLR
jgi:Putative adhesin